MQSENIRSNTLVQRVVYTDMISRGPKLLALADNDIDAASRCIALSSTAGSAARNATRALQRTTAIESTGQATRTAKVTYKLKNYGSFNRKLNEECLCHVSGVWEFDGQSR
jgi:2-methylisocitrate lyase-like PEP mutase family enzyme